MEVDDRSGVFFWTTTPCVYNTNGKWKTTFMAQTLAEWEHRRQAICHQLGQLGDLRPGSITSTSGRCGKPECRCHRPGEPGHGPNLRLTYKVDGKSVSESLPSPAAMRKAEREVAEFRKFQQLTREFVEANAGVCRLRPIEEEPPSGEGKKRRKRSARKSHAK
jgi:hypothetical protein